MSSYATKILPDFTKATNVRIHEPREVGAHIAFEVDDKTYYATYSALFRQFGVRATVGGEVIVWLDRKQTGTYPNRVWHFKIPGVVVKEEFDMGLPFCDNPKLVIEILSPAEIESVA